MLQSFSTCRFVQTNLPLCVLQTEKMKTPDFSFDDAGQ